MSLAKEFAMFTANMPWAFVVMAALILTIMAGSVALGQTRGSGRQKRVRKGTPPLPAIADTIAPADTLSPTEERER
jgi:uncharacterized membrane protein SirB2